MFTFYVEWNVLVFVFFCSCKFYTLPILYQVFIFNESSNWTHTCSSPLKSHRLVDPWSVEYYYRRLNSVWLSTFNLIIFVVILSVALFLVNTNILTFVYKLLFVSIKWKSSWISHVSIILSQQIIEVRSVLLTFVRITENFKEKMMKNSVCEFFLNPNGHFEGVYHCGQQLSGNVVLTFYEKQKIKSMWTFFSSNFITRRKKVRFHTNCYRYHFRYCHSNSWHWQVWMDWTTSIVSCWRDLFENWNQNLATNIR